MAVGATVEAGASRGPPEPEGPGLEALSVPARQARGVARAPGLTAGQAAAPAPTQPVLSSPGTVAAGQAPSGAASLAAALAASGRAPPRVGYSV